MYRNNSCIIKNQDVLGFNGVSEETMVELTPDLDFNNYYTPNGRDKSFILADGRRYSFDEFAVGVETGLDARPSSARTSTRSSTIFPPERRLSSGFVRSSTWNGLFVA